MPRNKRKQRRRRGGSLKWLPFNDYAGGIIGPGDVARWPRSSFTIPIDRSFRIIGFYVQAIAEVASATQGAIGGACFQVEVYNPVGTSSSMQLWNTGPIVIGTLPYRRRFRISSQVYPPDIVSTADLLKVSNVCQRKTDTASVRYVLRIDVVISPEEFGEKCPNLFGPPSLHRSRSQSSSSSISDLSESLAALSITASVEPS